MAEKPDPRKSQPTAPRQALDEMGTMRAAPAPAGPPPATASGSFHEAGTLKPGATPPAAPQPMGPGFSDIRTQRATPEAMPPAPPAELSADSATLRPAPAAAPAVDSFAKTGVMRARPVDQSAATMRGTGTEPPPQFDSESGTMRASPAALFAASASKGRRPGGGTGGSLEQLGQYQILKELGRGGMGVVYKAHHLTLNRDVALKVMLGADEATDSDRRRFLREAEACAALKHPNIVPVHDIDQVDGQYFFAMEFVEGTTLLDWSRSEPRSVAAIVEIMRKVCDALAYAHQRGIIHRDLKPHNVMVDGQGEPKVMDFGLAKRLGPGSAVPGAEKTVVGTIMGTPQYMPPEQATGRIDDVDTRSDVYALGVILYELIAGQLPIDAQSLQELLFKIEHFEPPLLREKRSDCPWELEVIVAKAMAKEKAQRFQTAQELAADLGRFLNKEPILARKAGLAYRARKFVQRNRTLSAIAATALVIGVTGGWFVWHEMERDQRAARAHVDGLVAQASEDVARVESALRDLERGAGSLKARDAVELIRQHARELEKAKGTIAAAQADAEPGDRRIEKLADAEKRIDDRYAALLERERVRLGLDEANEGRRKDAAALVAQAKALRAPVDPEKVDSEAAGAAAIRTLTAAREKIFKARGLDDANAEAATELDAVIETEKRVSEIAGRLRQREQYVLALADGRRKLDVARHLAGEREIADDEEAAPDALSNAFVDASLAFEKAFSFDNTSAEARAGIVDAALEEAKVAVEVDSDFRAAHRTAHKIEPLDPERVKRFRAELTKAEASSERAKKLVADARAERTRGNFASALAGFQQALDLDPGNGGLLFAADVCRARVACGEKRHLDELGVIEAAGREAPGAVELAEVDAERARNLRELVDEAARALGAGRTADASAIVERVLKVRPDDAGARRLRVELAGRQKTIAGMVFVSEGAFEYSLAPGQDTAVPAFLIGETEVTNADFARFVAAGGYTDPALRKHWPEEARPLLEAGLLVGRDRAPSPAGWVSAHPLPGTDLLPVAGVSWYEAAAYASWRGAVDHVPYRLPTEVEWEKAAVYDHVERKAVARPWKPAEWERFWSPYFDRVDGPKPVREAIGPGPDGAPLLDRSPCGAYDMYGNVHEWIAERAPDGRAILRGGSFLSRFPDRSAPTRRFPARPDFRADIVGFRLATAAPE